ncbi:hypothetical protein CsSME_00014071 [Camellia sinensis var. sinensis]
MTTISNPVIVSVFSNSNLDLFHFTGLNILVQIFSCVVDNNGTFWNLCQNSISTHCDWLCIISLSLISWKPKIRKIDVGINQSLKCKDLALKKKKKKKEI